MNVNIEVYYVFWTLVACFMSYRGGGRRKLNHVAYTLNLKVIFVDEIVKTKDFDLV